MIKESYSYKLALLLARYLKESRIYELVSKLFYFSRYSAVFELVRKKPKEDYIQQSIFLRALSNFYSKIIKGINRVLLSSKSLWTHSFLVCVARQQTRFMTEKPAFFCIFYAFIFYTGFIAGKIVKGGLSIKSLLLWVILLLLNFFCIQDAKRKFSKDSIIIKFLRDILA
ncbi:hypothetical protein COB47_1633 [Caldicellulosiruptor obsidiansis OB47]|uniref:Uncharacterized protein n=1 Tax=Caldicellulosiruptor obsidiansis (strain ATCC BAA-2073 / JCM 16842 / OB47) TaxID=608506 RepID=D9TFE6_CALOO|nr:hypothetical protein COB47_1633 [Caldicellulosiruptor obsidiansis OB47]